MTVFATNNKYVHYKDYRVQHLLVIYISRNEQYLSQKRLFQPH